VGRLSWSGDHTDNYHREGIVLGMEGIIVHRTPIRLNESSYASRMRRSRYGRTGHRFIRLNHRSVNYLKGFERKDGWSASSTTITSTPTRYGTFCLVYNRQRAEIRRQYIVFHVPNIHLRTETSVHAVREMQFSDKSFVILRNQT